jgi:hypothetical protein
MSYASVYVYINTIAIYTHMPQLIQNVSASASLMTIDANTRCPALQRPFISNTVDPCVEVHSSLFCNSTNMQSMHRKHSCYIKLHVWHNMSIKCAK